MGCHRRAFLSLKYSVSEVIHIAQRRHPRGVLIGGQSLKSDGYRHEI
jgi:hypothetical protein